MKDLRSKFKFVAGIGDRWDDNECHLALGCLSIILKEFEGNWTTARRYLLKQTCQAAPETLLKEPEVHPRVAACPGSGSGASPKR